MTPWPEWVSAIAAVIALGVAVWSAIDSRRSARGARLSASDAMDTAKRATAAAERSAVAAERSAAAHERQADPFTGLWTLRRVNGLVYLRNDTGEDAEDVGLSVDEPMSFLDEGWDAQERSPETASKMLGDLGRGTEADPFGLSSDDGRLDGRLWVAWRRPNGETSTWSCPVFAILVD